MSKQTEPWIRGRENAEIIRPFGSEMKVMLPAGRTNGTCSVLFADLKPGEGAPPHLHREYDEYFFVTEGTISLVIDGQESTIVPGTLAFTPRGAIHSFKNIGVSTASMLEWTVPGGNEPYFRAVSEMGADIDPKQLAHINARFATEFVRA